jgi:hypothetical protein
MSKSGEASILEHRSVLYVNVVIEDASEAIKAGVSQKLEDSNLPPGLKRRLAKYVGTLAADRVSVSQIVDTMAPRMVKTMPVKMRKKGLTIHAEEVFRDGPYFVIMMQVQHVDAAVLMEAKQLAEKHELPNDESWTVRFVKWLLSVLGMHIIDSVQTDYLPALIQSMMQPHMGEKMQAELAEKKMMASVEVLSEEKQARFFYVLLQQVRDSEAAKKEARKKGPPPNPFSRIAPRKDD